MNIMVLIRTMVVLFTIMLVGYGLNKLGILRKESNSVLSELIVKVTGPVLVVNSVCGIDTTKDKGQIIQIFFIGILLYALLIAFSQIIIRLLNLNKESGNIYALMLTFTNTSFIGFPILRVLYGDYAIFASSILHMPFNILIYSYGVYMIQKQGDDKRKFNIKDVLNTGVIAAIIALIIFLFGINVPGVVQEVLSMIGEITIPLSMILIGSSLALIPLKYVFSDIKIYLISFIKLIVMPAITYFIARLFTSDSFLIAQLTIATALPAGSMIVMLTTQYKGNVKTASVGVFITTVLSVITIPLMVYLLLN